MLYPVAPETAVQFSVASVEVIPVVFIPVGVLHTISVEKFVDAEKEERLELPQLV